MICMTGDVHHSTLNSDDLAYCKGTEIDAAATAARIAKIHGVKLTLFFTGLCSKEAPAILKKISDMENIEIGGHNYYAYKYKKLFNGFARLTGLRNGPYFYQAWEVRRTVRTLQSVTGRRITAWRDHAYRHDRNTRNILRQNDIRYLSDTLSPTGGQPVKNDGVIDVPINTVPDHDYVYHGSRQPGCFDEAHLKRTAFRTGGMSKDEWLERVKEQIREIDSKRQVAVILAHPACMEIMDNFSTFDRLCRFLTGFKTINMNEIQI